MTTCFFFFNFNPYCYICTVHKRLDGSWFLFFSVAFGHRWAAIAKKTRSRENDLI